MGVVGRRVNVVYIIIIKVVCWAGLLKRVALCTVHSRISLYGYWPPLFVHAALQFWPGDRFPVNYTNLTNDFRLLCNSSLFLFSMLSRGGQNFLLKHLDSWYFAWNLPVGGCFDWSADEFSPWDRSEVSNFEIVGSDSPLDSPTMEPWLGAPYASQYWYILPTESIFGSLGKAPSTNSWCSSSACQ